MVLLLWWYLMTLSVTSFTSRPNSQPFTIASTSINQIKHSIVTMATDTFHTTKHTCPTIEIFGKYKILLLKTHPMWKKLNPLLHKDEHLLGEDEGWSI